MSVPLFSKLMSVVIDGSTMACCTDFSLSMNRDLIEVACLDSEGAKLSIPDMYGWSVSGSGMVIRTTGMDAGDTGLFDMASTILTSDASVLVQILPDVSTQEYFSGAGYFSSLSMEGGVGAPVTYSFEITGSGVLSVLTTA